MIRELPVRAIASCFAMFAFALALLTGMLSGASFNDTMLRAILVLTACLVVGVLVARAASVAVAEHVETFQSGREKELATGDARIDPIELGESVDAPRVEAPARAAA